MAVKLSRYEAHMICYSTLFDIMPHSTWCTVGFFLVKSVCLQLPFFFNISCLCAVLPLLFLSSWLKIVSTVLYCLYILYGYLLWYVPTALVRVLIMPIPGSVTMSWHKNKNFTGMFLASFPITELHNSFFVTEEYIVPYLDALPAHINERTSFTSSGNDDGSYAIISTRWNVFFFFLFQTWLLFSVFGCRLPQSWIPAS